MTLAQYSDKVRKLGNITEVARMLGISRPTLSKRLGNKTKLTTEAKLAIQMLSCTNSGNRRSETIQRSRTHDELLDRIVHGGNPDLRENLAWVMKFEGGVMIAWMAFVHACERYEHLIFLPNVRVVAPPSEGEGGQQKGVTE